MADKKQDKNKAAQTAAGPNPQGSDNQQGKKGGILFGLLAFFTAVIVMAGILGGAFYMIIHNNVNGLADRYRKNIQSIPVLKLALPNPADPFDPKLFAPEELKSKYQELRAIRDDLTQKLNDANRKISELQKYKDELDRIKAENEKLKADAQAQKDQLDAERKKLEADTKKVNEMIASGDKTGFKEYFEKVDKETAAKVYQQIMQEQKAREDTKKFVQLYEGMDAAAAAAIFEQMGNSKMDTIVEILKNMKKDSSAQIIASMTPAFAATVTDRLSKVYLKDQVTPGSDQSKTQ